jgi:hypothetical protein
MGSGEVYASIMDWPFSLCSNISKHSRIDRLVFKMEMQHILLSGKKSIVKIYLDEF